MTTAIANDTVLLRCTGASPNVGGDRNQLTFNLLPPGTERASANSAAAVGTARLTLDGDTAEMLQRFRAGSIWSLSELTGGG